MKSINLVIIALFVSGLLFVVSAQIVSPQFSELKGMEDASANTHLFYRIYSFERTPTGNYTTDNSIYHLNILTGEDKLFLSDGGSGGVFHHSGITVHDYDFWNNDPTKYIYSGNIIGLDPIGYVKRFDQQNEFTHGFGGYNLDISHQDDSLVFVNLSDLFESTDGGFTWTGPSPVPEFNFISLFPLDDNIMFGYGYNGHLLKSYDRGLTFDVVDTVSSFNVNSVDFYYDPGGSQIYRLNQNFQGYYLAVSDDNGNEYSWSVKHISSDKLFFTIDTQAPGNIYLAEGRKILHSSDFGDTFSVINELSKKIVGIYKKPASDKLYAATKYALYEIIQDSLSIIKELPMPSELFAHYPLQVGNKWFYEGLYTHFQFGGSPVTEEVHFIKYVSGLELKPNGRLYFRIEDKELFNVIDTVYFERIDSSTAKIYRYSEDAAATNYEYLIDDLFTEVGDTIFASRFQTLQPGAFVIYMEDDYFNMFGLMRERKHFAGFDFLSQYYSLTQDIGLDSISVSEIDVFSASIGLKGCVINGVAYGDTIFTSVDEKFIQPDNHMLFQNYPNPFNPNTVISWQVPVGSRQVLKVFDVLGNEIATLVDEYRPAGKYEVEFNAVGTRSAMSLPSGVYIYRLTAGNYSDKKKLILLK